MQFPPPDARRPAQEPPIHKRFTTFALDVANGRSRYSKYLLPALLALDALLCGLIIWRIPYTEIDWVTYMEHISQYVSGERDYTKFTGGTGPLVYPAAHVYIYTALYRITDEGRDIFLAQQLFAILYIVTLGVVMACYWRAKAPPYIFPLLILSKRLHSIFVLRCFNDCFATLFLWLAIFFLQRRDWATAAIVYSLGLGVKMSLLLVLPAVGLILFLGRGFSGTLRLASLMLQLQVALGLPFLLGNAWGYLGRAFELSRQFLYKWTVNWRFIEEDTFLSLEFAIILLVLHVTVLAFFIFGRWLQQAGKPIMEVVMPLLFFTVPFTKEEEKTVSQRVTPQYVLTTMLTANVIGMLFARSLHYQFYAYLAWATPFLLWRSGIHPVLQYGLWAAQEWAWNVYPSTPISSGVVVGVLAATVGLVWVGTRDRALEWTIARDHRFASRVPATKPEAAKR